MSNDLFILLTRILATLATLVLMIGIGGPLILQRIKRRRRCPRCWYDMSHTPGLRCSECGRTARKERHLRRTRRRLIWPLIALLLATGAYSTHVAPAVRDRGWPAAIPDPLLIASTPFLNPDLQVFGTTRNIITGALRTPDRFHDQIYIELTRRTRQPETLDFFDRQVLRFACFLARIDNTPQARRPPRPWPTLYDRLVDSTRWANDRTLNWQINDLAPAERYDLHTRDQWPGGATVYATIAARDQPPRYVGVPFVHESRIIATAESPSAADWVQVFPAAASLNRMYAPAREWDDNMFPVGVAGRNTGPHTSTYNCLRSVRQNDVFVGAQRWFGRVEQPLSLTFEIVADIDDILTPVDPAGFTDQLSAGLQPVVMRAQLAGRDSPHLLLHLDNRGDDDFREMLKDYPDLTFAFIAEVIFQHRVIARARAWYTMGSYHWAPLGSHLVLEVVDAHACEALATGMPGLTVRFQGDAETALRHRQSTQYWSGAVTLDAQAHGSLDASTPAALGFPPPPRTTPLPSSPGIPE